MHDSLLATMELQAQRQADIHVDSRRLFVAACGGMTRCWHLIGPEGVHALGAAQAMVVAQEKQSYESVASDVELRAQIDVRSPALMPVITALPLGCVLHKHKGLQVFIGGAVYRKQHCQVCKSTTATACEFAHKSEMKKA